MKTVVSFALGAFAPILLWLLATTAGRAIEFDPIFLFMNLVTAMLKKTRLFPGIFACMLALDSIAHASAGESSGVHTMDIICVEVARTRCPNAPVETYTDVRKDWSITKPDKLCYRRASTPGTIQG
jgi:hypothetical protein